MHGTARVEETEGGGATFVVELPVFVTIPTEIAAEA